MLRCTRLFSTPSSHAVISNNNKIGFPRFHLTRRFCFSLLLALICLAGLLPATANAYDRAYDPISYGQTIKWHKGGYFYFQGSAGETVSIQVNRHHYNAQYPLASIAIDLVDNRKSNDILEDEHNFANGPYYSRNLRLPQTGRYSIGFFIKDAYWALGPGFDFTLTLTLQQPVCQRLDAKLRPGLRAMNSVSSHLNIRDQASISGNKLGELPSGQVVDVLEGPVDANNYYWFKIRHGDVTGWSAESGNCKYWLEQTSDQASKPARVEAGQAIVVGERCGLAEAIAAANTDRASGGCLGGNGADTIELGMDIALESNLPSVSSGITIDGGGRAISGENSYRIFEVAAGGNLTLYDLTLRGGKTEGHGGAIYNKGAVSAINSEFRDNSADGDGGAIFNDGSLIVLGSGFSNNTAGGSGGAIHHAGFSIALDGGARFSGNSPQNCVGADCGDVPPLDSSLPAIAEGGSLTGSLPAGAANNRVQLRLLNRTVLSARMTAPDGDMVPGLALWGGGDKQAEDANEAGLNIAELENIELEAGLYEFEAWTARGGGRYELEVFDGGLPEAEGRVVPSEAPAPDPDLPLIEVGGSLEGFLSDSDAVDKIQLRLLSEATVTIRMSACMMPRLTLSRDGEKLAESASRGGSNTAELTDVDLGPGLYTISARSLSGGGDYKLEAYSGARTQTSFPAPDIGKPTVSFGGMHHGSLPAGADYDTIQLCLLSSASGISIRMSGASGDLAPGLTLWGNNGRELAGDQAESPRDIAELTNITLEPGVYDISAWSVSGVGDYNLMVS